MLGWKTEVEGSSFAKIVCKVSDLPTFDLRFIWLQERVQEFNILVFALGKNANSGGVH